MVRQVNIARGQTYGRLQHRGDQHRRSLGLAELLVVVHHVAMVLCRVVLLTSPHRSYMVLRMTVCCRHIPSFVQGCTFLQNIECKVVACTHTENKLFSSKL
ncbi:hypothetical protein DAI22_02g036500 [Oryza sativa Japonica Group]|nr:hypothetical protein DAI22_02g036500 [Oryza sativa Japonica Group]